MIKVLKKGKELTSWKTENTPGICPLCNRDMDTVISRNKVVDHDHKTGQIRGVLCRNCNALEGKLNNICVRSGNWITHKQFLLNIIKYWSKLSKGNPYYPGTKIIKGKPVAQKIKRRRKY